MPERSRWAVNMLAVDPDDRILEIGGGRGIAAALICERLSNGRLVGLDRSPKATAASLQRNAQAVERGVAEFHTCALENADPDLLGEFDTIFAVNVNVFWAQPAQAELRVVARLLRPGGCLWLFYEPPDPGRLGHLERLLLLRLEHAGYRPRTVTGPGKNTVLFAVAAPHP